MGKLLKFYVIMIVLIVVFILFMPNEIKENRKEYYKCLKEAESNPSDIITCHDKCIERANEIFNFENW